MSNPRFYSGQLAGNVYTMSLTENANYPLSNLLTYLPTDLWKSSASTDGQTLNIDLGSAKAIDTLILQNHNFNLMGSVILEYDLGDDPAFPNPDPYVINLGALPTSIGKANFVAKTKRYWRLHFVTASGATPQLGQIFLSGELDLGIPYNLSYRGGNQRFATAEKNSLSGVFRTSQTFGGKTVFEISFSLGNNTFKTNWLDFHNNQVRGKLYPFYFADMDDLIYYVKFTQDYNPTETIAYQINNVQTVVLQAQ